MLKTAAVVLFALCIVMSLPSLSGAQDHSAQTTKKETVKNEKVLGPLKTLSCDSPCDFSVASHDESEVVAMGISHIKKHHNMDVSEKDVKGMLKTSESKETMKKEKSKY